MNGILEALRRLGPTRVLLAGVGLATVLAALGTLAVRLSTPSMALLYGDLTVEDSSQIISKLEAAQVPFELRGNGTQILVPQDQALRLRMQMAGAGLPSGGSHGYELFDRGESLGTTDFVQKINHLRALEGELARTIRSIDRVRSARVHLVLPRREIFAREKREPSASIVLKVQGNLEQSQVRAIQHLAASAVPDLSPGRVSIVDDRGTLLSRGERQGDTLGAGGLNELRLAQENRLKAAIESLVEQSVGVGNVRAEVSAEMNFDRITENTERFDPDGQVIRSTQTVEESNQSQEGSAEDTVTVANNLPDAQAAGNDGPSATNNSARLEETVNYEISRTTRTEVHEVGTLERVSVAVLVNGAYQQNGESGTQYRERSAEELQKIATLVKSAIGYDEARGDRVEVVNMRFASFDEAAGSTGEEPGPFLTKADYLRLAEVIAFVIVGGLIVFLVLRPLLARLLDQPLRAPPQQQLPAPAAGNAPALPPAQQAQEKKQILQAVENGDVTPEEAQALIAAQSKQEPVEEMLDIDKIEGRVKASSLRKLGGLIDKHPDEALSIVRAWMYQDA